MHLKMLWRTKFRFLKKEIVKFTNPGPISFSVFFLEMEMEMGFFLPTEHLKSAQELVQHVSVHSGSNWNLAVFVFEERGKSE